MTSTIEIEADQGSKLIVVQPAEIRKLRLNSLDSFPDILLEYHLTLSLGDRFAFVKITVFVSSAIVAPS